MVTEIFIRLLASVLPLSVGIAAILTFAAALDNAIFAPLVVGLVVSFVWMFVRFEDIVEDVEGAIDSLTAEDDDL